MMTHLSRILAMVAVAAAAGIPFGLGATAPSEPPKAVQSFDWPQHRGVHRDGHAPVPSGFEPWPDDGSPEVLWRRDIGAGYSAISVIGSHAVTLWQEGDRQLLGSFDSSDGTPRWSAPLGPAFRSEYGDGPRSSPVIADGAVFAIDAHGNLHAHRLDDGALLWSRDLARELDARIPPIGYSSTPIVEGANLIVEVGGPDKAFVAFERTSGRIAWASGSDPSAYASPIAISVGSTRQVLFLSARGLRALDASDGRLLWSFPWEGLCPSTGIPLNSATPIFVPPDRVFVSGAYGSARGAAMVRIVSEGGRFETEVLWRNEAIDSRINSGVLVEGSIYGFKGNFLRGIDVETGETHWSSRGYQRGSLIAAGDQLVVLGEQGVLGLVEASPEGFHEKARAPMLEGRSWTAPGWADGKIFLRNQEEIVVARLEPAATP